MSFTVEIENPINLKKARRIAGVNSDGKVIELALEKYIKDYEPKPANKKKGDLPQSYWDDLFSDPPLPAGTTIKAVLDDRDEARY